MFFVICLRYFVAVQNNQRDAGTQAGTPLPYCRAPMKRQQIQSWVNLAVEHGSICRVDRVGVTANGVGAGNRHPVRAEAG